MPNQVQLLADTHTYAVILSDRTKIHTNMARRLWASVCHFVSRQTNPYKSDRYVHMYKIKPCRCRTKSKKKIKKNLHV